MTEFFISGGKIVICCLAKVAYKMFVTWLLCKHPELTDKQTESIAKMATTTIIVQPPHKNKTSND